MRIQKFQSCPCSFTRINTIVLLLAGILLIGVAAGCQTQYSSSDKTAFSSQPASLTVEQYTAQGSSSYEKADYQQAIDDFSHAIKLSPDTAKLYMLRGLAYKQRQQYDLALADLSKAILLDPVNVNDYYERSKIYQYLNDWGKSIADCEKSIQLNPGLTEAYYIRGLANIKQGKFTEAISDLNAALGLESAANESAELKMLTDRAVPGGELVLLKAEWNSQQTGICNEAICWAPIGFNVTLRLDLFANPGASGIVINSMNVSPALDGKSKIDVNRTFKNSGIQGFALNLSSKSPVSSALNCSANYKSISDLFNKTSNSINHG